MIHYLTVKQRAGDDVVLKNNDGTEKFEQDDGVTSIEVTAEQHYGIRIYDDADGHTHVVVREGGGGSEPMTMRDFVRRVMV
jgi:hypothetical protein